MKCFLKKHGFKVTKSRLKILHALANSKNKHLSVEDLFNIFKSQDGYSSLATIYRILSQFEKAKIVIKHNFEDEKGSVFELLTKDQGQHDHLVCINCNKVIEFTDLIIKKQLHKIAEQHKFNILEHNLSVRGKCRDC